MARFYLDEDIPPDVVPILVHYNQEVVHVVESGNRSLSDPEHLLIAARSERILVTYNRRDFRQLHQFWTALNVWGNLGQRHAGILTCWGQVPKIQWAILVHDFVSRGSNLDNQMWEWKRQQQEWEQFGW